MQYVSNNLTGPDGGIVHSGERESNGKYTFAAHQEGTYKYCFSNKVILKILELLYYYFIIHKQHGIHQINLFFIIDEYNDSKNCYVQHGTR